jgi:hypothetical protein
LECINFGTKPLTRKQISHRTTDMRKLKETGCTEAPHTIAKRREDTYLCFKFQDSFEIKKHDFYYTQFSGTKKKFIG